MSSLPRSSSSSRYHGVNKKEVWRIWSLPMILYTETDSALKLGYESENIFSVRWFNSPEIVFEIWIFCCVICCKDIDSASYTPCAVILINFRRFQTYYVNWGIAQKNRCHFPNLIFMLILILQNNISMEESIRFTFPILMFTFTEYTRN